MEAFAVGFVILVFGSCIAKGKWGMALAGLFVMGIFAIVGAIRIAKPGSYWDRQNYPIGGGKYLLARERFNV